MHYTDKLFRIYKKEKRKIIYSFSRAYNNCKYMFMIIQLNGESTQHHNNQ